VKLHKAKDIDSALAKKGFQKSIAQSHWRFVFFYDNKMTQIHTKLSMGRSSNDPGRDNLQKMKRDLRFDNYNDFSDLIDCPYTQEMYIAMLKEKKLL
jgi:heme oxygenase